MKILAGFAIIFILTFLGYSVITNMEEQEREEAITWIKTTSVVIGLVISIVVFIVTVF